MTTKQNLPEHPLLGQQEKTYRRIENKGCTMFAVAAIFLFGLMGLISMTQKIARHSYFYQHAPHWSDYLGWGFMIVIYLSMIIIAIYILYNDYKTRGLSVTVYNDGLLWSQKGEDAVIRWDDIHTLRHNETNTSFRGMRIIIQNYQIELQNGRSFSFNRALENVVELGRTIKYQLHPRLMPPVQKQLQQGEIISFGNLSVGQKGMYRRGRLIPWKTIESVDITKDRFCVRGANRRILAKATARHIPNLFLLEEISQSRQHRPH